jgi:hypothetical protein
MDRRRKLLVFYMGSYKGKIQPCCGNLIISPTCHRAIPANTRDMQRDGECLLLDQLDQDLDDVSLEVLAPVCHGGLPFL